jgi:hypothetical protein
VFAANRERQRMTDTIAWTQGTWTNDPAAVTIDETGLHVTAREGSDAVVASMTSPRLTVEDVRAMIAASDRPHPRHWIGADGRLPGDDNMSALVRQADGTWVVAYFERGSYQYPEKYATEDEACRAFLALVRLPAPGDGLDAPRWRRR